MANNWKINKTVDLTRGIDGVEVWPHALLVTGDKNAHEWNVTVMNNGKEANLSGNIQAYFVRSDGATVTTTGSVAGNVATVTLPEACYAYEGDLSAVMQLIQDDASVTLSALLLRVRQITTDVIIDPGTEIPSLDDLLAQIENMKKATGDANAATSKANTAATNADDAAGLANAAANRVDESIKSANTATERANAAAKAAEEIVVEKNIATKDYVGEQIDSLEIIGLNYLSNTKLPGAISVNTPSMSNNFQTFDPYSTPGRKKLGELGFEANDQVTLSFDWQISQNESLEYTYGYISAEWLGWKDGSDNQFLGTLKSRIVEFSAKNTNGHAVVTTTLNTDVLQAHTIRLRFDGCVLNFTISNCKLEKGNRATDRTLSLYDVDVDEEIGGMNILRGTNTVRTLTSNGEWVNANWREASGGIGTRQSIEVNDAPNANIHVGWSITRQSGDLDISQDYVPVQAGDTYTMSCYARGTGGLTLQYGKGGYVRKVIQLSNVTKWIRYAMTFVVGERDDGSGDGSTSVYFGNREGTSAIEICGMKLEHGNKPTDWSPAPEDIDRAISHRTAVTYDYGGRNLKEVFGTPEALHNALAVEDYTNIAVGDYWPITLNGTFWDYGDGDDHTERNCNNLVVKLEIAGINHYWRYGDNGELSDNMPHIVFISRDCLPFWVRMRKDDTKWEDETATNPWLGSALYKTLNDQGHGIIRLLTETEFGQYIYAGPNDLGMRAQMETKAPGATNATGWAWYDRGKLFLPSVSEVWGNPYWCDANWSGGLGNQFAIFRDSRRHISKGGGDGAARSTWWLASPGIDSATLFANVPSGGYATTSTATSLFTFPICFIFA